MSGRCEAFWTVKTSATIFGEISQHWQNLQVLGNFYRINLLFGKKLACFGKFCIPLGQILIDVNCQMLKNNLAIWYTGTGQTFFVCFLTSNNCHILQTYRKHFQCNKLFMTLRTFIIFVITKDKARLLLDGVKNKTDNL